MIETGIITAQGVRPLRGNELYNWRLVSEKYRADVCKYEGVGIDDAGDDGVAIGDIRVLKTRVSFSLRVGYEPVEKYYISRANLIGKKKNDPQSLQGAVDSITQI